MSGIRKVYNDGEAINTIDLNLLNQSLAAADDRALAALLADASNSKRVWPLADSDYDGANLVVTGSTIGTVGLLPCTLVAGNSSNPRAVELSTTLESFLQSNLVAANPSGSTRVDLIYATVRRTSPASLTPATGSVYVGTEGVDLRAYPSAQAQRTVKSPLSGNVTTQTITIVEVPTITLNILQGTPGGGAPSLPADTAPTGAVTDGVYNFALATLNVAPGYASGGSISQSDITQTWTSALLTAQKLAVYDSVGSTSAPTPTFARGRLYKQSLPFALASVSSAGAFVGGMNVASTSRTSAGNYVVNLATAAATTGSLIILVNATPTIGFAGGAAASTTAIDVNTRNTSGTLTDLDFHMVIYHV